MKEKLLEIGRHIALLFLSFVFVIGACVAFLYVSKYAQEAYDEVEKYYRELTRDPSSVDYKHIKNWGLINELAKSHVDAVCAWTESKPVADVIVAVIDTGIDAQHADLNGKLWCDPAIKDGCQYGWNFVANKPNPVDEHGHGTHVAGIIAAIPDKEHGAVGLSGRAQIMSVKYYSDANPGSVNLRNTVSAIGYAVEHGARIINYSGGGPEFSEDEYMAIKKAEAKGVLFVAAAGNEHQDSDKVENYYYPSAYRLNNIISVAATDIHNHLLPSSNWGKKKVDVAAPGENIFSTLPGGRFGYMSGTSQATAFVTGIAALILSEHPNFSVDQVKEAILSTVDRFPQLENKDVTGGRVNACAAVIKARALDKKN